MSDFLQHYFMKIHACSPIHIGNGQKVGKKEYIYLPWEHKILIPEMYKMYEALSRRGKGQAYIDYMMKRGNEDLGAWLRQQGFSKKDYERWQLYELDAGEIPLNSTTFKGAKAREIACFIKDAYRMPYVPGSSIKGMIRTALLAWELGKPGNPYNKNKVKDHAGNRDSRKNLLNREMKELETSVLHSQRTEETRKETRKETRLEDAVNSNMAGLIIGDSQPTGRECLSLCQKIDYTLDGQERALPILREVLIPGTDIYFELTIDATRCPYTIQDIFEAVNYFQEISQKYFYSRFRRGTTEENIVWLGGGAGFLSKTLLYPMFGKDAVEVTDKVFRNTLGDNYGKHKHSKDKSLGIAPHMCKCTRYGGQLYDMGMGRIELIKN